MVTSGLVYNLHYFDGRANPARNPAVLVGVRQLVIRLVTIFHKAIQP